MRKDTIKKIIAYFEENEEVFNRCIEELDGYNGYLGDDRYIPMEQLDEIYFNENPLEILQRAYYGHDADIWHTDSRGEKEYGAFNPNRDYFTFNGYGNLISTDYPNYSAFLDPYVVEEMSEQRRWIDSIEDENELVELFDELESADE